MILLVYEYRVTLSHELFVMSVILSIPVDKTPIPFPLHSCFQTVNLSTFFDIQP